MQAQEHTSSIEQGTISPGDHPKIVQNASKKRPAQALNSRVAKKASNMISCHSRSQDWLDKVPECPVFRPSREEFQDPLAYIRSVQREAEKWGICKIIPPVTPAVPGGLVCRELNGAVLKFTTREQPVRERLWHDMDEGKFTQGETLYTLQQYSKLADDFQRKQLGASGTCPARTVENEYWRQRKVASDLTVEYGNDVEGTAFCSPSEGDPLGSTDWNLQLLPRLQNSTLRLLKGEVPGITTPMLYIGMLYATFAWHVEDHNLYSINYQHLGASKTWYGVPGIAADGFEKVVEEQVYARALQAEKLSGREACVAAHRAILGKTTMFSPQLLLSAGVRVCRAVQQPGEFIVTFPRAYHAGFSNGFCVGEAVNFAMHDWYQFGADCCLRYRRLAQPPILPHDELICEEALLLRDRLADEQGACCSADPAADVSLAGTFVTLLRQQNKQRRVMVVQRGLTQRPMATDVDDGLSCQDCVSCAHLCFLASVTCQVNKEPLCMECAMRENVMGPSNELFCHPELEKFEDCARWFEQQPLLKDSDWEGSLQNRGLTEGELHSGGWGHHNSRTVPAPNQAFLWEKLPSAVPAPGTAAPSEEKEVLACVATTEAVLVPDNASLPRVKVVFSPIGPYEGLGFLQPVLPQQPAWGAAPSDAGGSAASDSNISVDVVGVSTVRDPAGESSSADVSSGNKEHTPTSTLDSATALCTWPPVKGATLGDSTQPDAAPVQQDKQPCATGAHDGTGDRADDAAPAPKDPAMEDPALEDPVPAASPAKKAKAAAAASKTPKAAAAASRTPKAAAAASRTPKAETKEAPATGPRFFSGEGGPVVLVEDTMVTMGGKKMRRRVYSLEKDLTQRFLPTRELSKAADFLACPAEGARDTVFKQWRKATDKAAEAAAAGFTVPELPEKPRRYTCKRDPYIITTFLVGLDEVARIFYWVANPRQRCDLEKFCKGVWPERLQNRCAGMPELADSPTQEVTAQKKKAAGKVRKEAKLRGAVTKPVRETRAAKIRGVWSVEGCGAMALSPADLAKLGQHAKTGKPGKRASRFLAKQSCTLS